MLKDLKTLVTETLFVPRGGDVQRFVSESVPLCPGWGQSCRVEFQPHHQEVSWLLLCKRTWKDVHWLMIRNRLKPCQDFLQLSTKKKDNCRASLNIETRTFNVSVTEQYEQRVLKINIKKGVEISGEQQQKQTWQIPQSFSFSLPLTEPKNNKDRADKRRRRFVFSVNGAVMTQCFSVSRVSQPTPKGPGLWDTKARINGALEKLMENH